MPVEVVRIGDVSTVPAADTPGRNVSEPVPAAESGAIARQVAVPAVGEEPGRVDRAAVEKALRKLNLLTLETPVRLSFQIHEGTGRMMVRVIHEDTGEVVKEIPPHEILDTVARIMKFVGLLLDRRV